MNSCEATKQITGGATIGLPRMVKGGRIKAATISGVQSNKSGTVGVRLMEINCRGDGLASQRRGNIAHGA
jgi:hypothetical protein